MSFEFSSTETNETPRKNIQLEKHDGKISQIKEIQKGDSFEDGTFSKSVHEIDVAIPEKEREKERSFVVKEFKEAGAAQHAFESYKKLKEIGLRVPPTYRLDRENNRIFMTNYNINNLAAISATGENRHVNNLTIESILNIDALKKIMKEQCVLAANKRVRLPIDAFFFIVPRNGGQINMDFVIGDLDLIFSDYAKELNLDEKACFKENIKNANEALTLIIDKYVE
jgi:hypothetical protein